MMKYTITTAIFVALLSVLQAQIEIQLNLQPGDCFCEGTPQQPFTVTAEGSAGPFTYLWAGPDGYYSLDKEPTDIDKAGVYSLKVFNAYSCSFSYGVELEACPGPQFQFTQNNCIGEIVLGIENGAPPFSVNWFNQGTGESLGQSGTSITVGDGLYFAEVTDGNGCIWQTQAIEMEFDSAPLELEAIVDPVTCASAADGSITINIANGTPEYAFNWFLLGPNGSPLPIDVADPSSNILDQVSMGLYNVIVEDQNGCGGFLLEIEVGQEPIIETQPPFITQTKVFAEVQGAQKLIYQGNWQDNGEGCFELQIQEGLDVGQEEIFAIQQGADLTIQVFTNVPMQWMTVSLPGTAVFELGVTSFPGSGQSWTFGLGSVPEISMGSNGVEQILSFAGIDNSGNALPLLNPLALLDNTDNCFELPVQQPDCSWEPSYSEGNDDSHIILIQGCNGLSAPTNSSCPIITPVSECGLSDGSITSRVSCSFGGEIPYTYLWSNGATTLNISNLSGGHYTLTVNDAIGCTGTFEYFVPSFGEPLIDQGLTSVVNTCSGQNNGRIIVALSLIDPDNSGNEPPIDASFEWSNGASASNNVFSVQENLSPGTYTVTITNLATQCSIIEDFTVQEVVADAPLTVTAQTLGDICYGSNSGSVKLTMTGGIPPYYRNGAEVSGGTLEINQQYPEGQHCETITDHCGESFQVCFDIEVIESSIFSIFLADIDHVSSSGADDGSASISVAPAGDYSYEWLPYSEFLGISPSVDGLEVGSYSVRVEDNLSGCVEFQNIEIKECTTVQTDFIVKIQGGSNFSQNEDIQFAAIVINSESGEVLSDSELDGFSFSWTAPVAGAPALGNDISILLPSDYPHEQVNLRVTDGCSTEYAVKKILSCSVNSLAYPNIFILSVKPPCENSADGVINFDIPTPENAEVQLLVNGIEYEIIPVGSGMSTIVSAGGLTEGTYSINIVIAGCEFSFLYDLEDETPEREYSHYVPEENLCYFTETTCDGVPTGDGEYYINEGDYLWGGSIDLAWGSSCSTPVTCPGLPNDQVVYEDQFEKVWMRNAEYQYLLYQAQQNGDYPTWYIDLLIEQIHNEGLWPCTGVRVCKKSLKFIGKSFAFSQGEVTSLENGCIELQCGALSMETCPDDVFEYYDPIDEDGPIAYSTCIPRVLSLAALYEHNQYYIDNEDFYFGSDLHSFVEENGTAPGANCATVTYCSGREDLKVIHDNLDEVECGLDIVDCAQENIVLGQTCEESYIPNIGTLVFCENPFGCNFLLNYIYLIPSGIYALQSPNDTEMQLVKNQFFNDQNQHEEVSAFGYSKIGDNRIPLSIVSSPGLENNLFYDYNLHPQSVQVDKDSIPEISHFIEDWNQEYTAVIKPTNLGNELVIYKEDTLIAWNQYLDSDTQLETVGFEESSGIFIISGFFNGTLRFSGSEVAHTETQSLFVLKLSASDGEFIGVDIFEMPNNNSEIRLIEDGRIRNGAIIATAQYNNSPSGFQINNSNYSTLFDNGVALLEFKVAEEEPSIIAEISIDDEVSLINSDLSTSNQAILVFTGQGHILVGEEVLETTDDNLLIVSLNLELEVVNWNISQPLEGLHLENSDFKIDNEGNFIGGLTFTNSVTILDTVFTSFGAEDILLFRIDNSGSLRWVEQYGTSESESLGELYPDKGILHFNGHFTGTITEKKIGEITFVNLFPTMQRGFVSYALPYGELNNNPHSLVQGVNPQMSKGVKTQDSFFEVFPNPMQDQLFVEIKSPNISRLIIFDILGREVYSSQLVNFGNTLELDCSQFESGGYFITFWSQNQEMVGAQRLIKN